MAKSSTIILALLLITQFSFGQNGRYAIFFKDKSGSSFSTNNPIAFLSQKSIDRRIKNDVSTTEEDFPVSPDYVTQLNNTGAKVLHTSRWMNCALVQVEGGELADVLNLPFVVTAEYLGPLKTFSGGRTGRVRQNKDTKAGEANTMQNAMLGLNEMHNDNVYGEGVTIAVFDSGFIGVDVHAPFTHLFTNGQIQFTADLVGLTNNVYQYDDHGTEVLSVMAAQQEGVYIGGTPKANYHLYLTEDVQREHRIEEYNWLVAAEKADSAGVDIITTSLGYNLFDDPSMNYTTSQLDGGTALVSRAAAKALAKGMVVVVSAGNEGNTAWKLVDPPADVDGVLAVGAINMSGSLSGFSSIAPTSDNRIKPDVVALGSNVTVIKSNGATGTSSGTSVATPLVASLAAGLIQVFPELTVAELYQLIIASADLSQNPNNQKGYGVPNYISAKIILGDDGSVVPPSAIHIYPNPTIGDLVKIKVDAPPGQLAVLRLYNIQGSIVMKSEGALSYVNNPIELDLSGFSAGLYILKVEIGSILKTVRLIKF